MAKKKRSSPPQQVNGGLVHRNDDSRTSLTPRVSSVGVPMADSGDDMVVPPPSVVHPSVGAIPRQDAEMIKQAMEAYPPMDTLGSNGTVPPRVTEVDDSGKGSVPVANSWARVVTGMASRGASLSFVPPKVHDGKLVAHLLETELKDGCNKWKSALIMYVVGFTPTIAALKAYFTRSWTVALPEIFKHDDGFFILKFASQSDRNLVIANGPYSYNSRPVILKPWHAEYSFKDEVLRTMPLWVRLPNLPLHCWSADSLSRIASLVGTPICADECTTKQARISYARLFIEVDVTKPITRNIWIEGIKGELVEQAVWYEWAPLYCEQCKVAGHNCQAKRPAKKQWVPKKYVPQPQATVQQHSSRLNIIANTRKLMRLRFKIL